MYLDQLMSAEEKANPTVNSPLTAAKIERRFDFTVPFAQRAADPAKLLEKQNAIAEKSLQAQQIKKLSSSGIVPAPALPPDS